MLILRIFNKPIFEAAADINAVSGYISKYVLSKSWANSHIRFSPTLPEYLIYLSGAGFRGVQKI